jgi:hypothetical protein
MTLATRVLITAPVTPKKLWDDILEIVAKDFDRPVQVKDEISTSYHRVPEDITDARTTQTLIGQGLPAWTWMTYRNFGDPFPSYTQDPEDYDDPTTFPASYADVMFDTSYGYQDSYGGCATLHARFLVHLLQKGYTFSWVNEFTGELHEGLDGLEAFMDGGAEAEEWFQTVVLPVIEEEMRGEAQ